MESVLKWIVGAVAILAAGLVAAGLAAQTPPAREAAEPRPQPKPGGCARR